MRQRMQERGNVHSNDMDASNYIASSFRYYLTSKSYVAHFFFGWTTWYCSSLVYTQGEEIHVWQESNTNGRAMPAQMKDDLLKKAHWYNPKGRCKVRLRACTLCLQPVYSSYIQHIWLVYSICTTYLAHIWHISGYYRVHI